MRERGSGSRMSASRTPAIRHGEILFRLLETVGAAGILTTDAHLAAQAVQHQAALHSTDPDFARFSGGPIQSRESHDSPSESIATDVSQVPGKIVEPFSGMVANDSVGERLAPIGYSSRPASDVCEQSSC
jgi:hypothetical protein